MNTFTLNMFVSMSYTGLTKRNTLLVAPQEYVNIYSTRRLLTPFCSHPPLSSQGVKVEVLEAVKA